MRTVTPLPARLRSERPPRDPGRQRGATSIEYALLGALIAVAIVVSVSTLGTDLQARYSGVASSVSAATGGN